MTAHPRATRQAERFCRKRAAPDGSNLYYATLFAPPGLRRQLFALHAFAREIEESVFRVSDPGVVRMRLQWWRQELANMAAGRPDHPVTRELTSLSTSGETTSNPFFSRGRLDALIDAREKQLQPAPRLADLGEIFAACRNSGGRLWQWTARLCDAWEDRELNGRDLAEKAELAFNATTEPATQLGCAEEVLHTLERLCRKFSERSYQPVTFDLARNGCGYPPELLAPLIDSLRQRIESAEADFPPARLPCRIAARLLAAACREILDSGCRLEDRRITLSPLYKLWIAWRTYRTQCRPG